MKSDKLSDDGSIPSDCLACRLTGGFGCIGASTYVGYVASKNKNPFGRTITFLFAGALGGLGLTRLLSITSADAKIGELQK